MPCPLSSHGFPVQVSYLAIGPTRPILEAAAARAMKHVPRWVVDQVLRDLGCSGKLRLAHERVAAIISACQHEWGWSDIDVARALSFVLPGIRMKPAKRQPMPEVEAEMVWDDITSIAQALMHHSAAGESAPPSEPAAAAVADDTDAVVRALVRQSGTESPTSHHR